MFHLQTPAARHVNITNPLNARAQSTDPQPDEHHIRFWRCRHAEAQLLFHNLSSDQIILVGKFVDQSNHLSSAKLLAQAKALQAGLSPKSDRPDFNFIPSSRMKQHAR